ncbi:hypothetical protein ACCI51_17840 [Microbulbifer echini]|uniref:Uncharacterized protein n=1 Tax=Microbulbifer echini TaxID=1529067 RepID=A0ABV4NT85_9GAMM|nr:hypothetical protein [uncultured Microbulbifer sp.]
MAAIDTLRKQCIGRFDLDCGDDTSTFLDKLRPFSEVSMSDFYQIICAAEEIYQSTANDQVIDKDVIYQLNGCAHYVYIWALRDGAMLTCNGLISDAQKKQLEKIYKVLMGVIAQLCNPHDRSDNGTSPMEVYVGEFGTGDNK